MKKFITLLALLYISSVIANANGVATRVPLYFDLDSGKVIATDATFVVTRIPINLKLEDIKVPLCGNLIPKQTLEDFFSAIEQNDIQKITKLTAVKDHESVSRLLKKFSNRNINFESLTILDLFPIENRVKVFYEIDDPKQINKKLVSFLTFEKASDSNYYRVSRSNNEIETLLSYSLLRYYNSKEYRDNGFAKTSQNASEFPILNIRDFDFKNLIFPKGNSDVTAFYNSFVSTRSSGDLQIMPSFYTDVSRLKVQSLIDSNHYEMGDKYNTKRQANNTVLLGIIPLYPLYVVVEKINPRNDETYFKYVFILKDSAGNMQITNVFYESFFDDLLKTYNMTPQL